MRGKLTKWTDFFNMQGRGTEEGFQRCISRLKTSVYTIWSFLKKRFGRLHPDRTNGSLPHSCSQRYKHTSYLPASSEEILYSLSSNCFQIGNSSYEFFLANGSLFLLRPWNALSHVWSQAYAKCLKLISESILCQWGVGEHVLHEKDVNSEQRWINWKVSCLCFIHLCGHKFITVDKTSYDE